MVILMANTGPIQGIIQGLLGAEFFIPDPVTIKNFFHVPEAKELRPY